MAVPEYIKPIQLTKETQDWISKMNGAIQHARNHPNTNQRGYNPEFWQRLRSTNIKTIPDGNQVASHKMAYGEADGKIYVYPLIQEVDGKLVDFSSNNDEAFQNAVKNNNFVIAPSKDIADNFAKYYKESESFPGFKKFQPISNTKYNGIVMNNKPRMFAVYNKLLKSGYSSEQAAGILGNLVVEGELNEWSKEKNGKGIGLAQWTDPSRQQNMILHFDPSFSSEFERQVDFLAKEAKDKKVWANAKKNKTNFEKQKIPYRNISADQSAYYFMKGFENPKASASHEFDRKEIANYVMSPEFQNEYQAQLLYKKSGGIMNYLNYIQNDNRRN